jgi:hypothetical protein
MFIEELTTFKDRACTVISLKDRTDRGRHVLKRVVVEFIKKKHIHEGWSSRKIALVARGRLASWYRYPRVVYDFSQGKWRVA